jgi:radical SAM superfamily enzyme YgiQ (UPF0313 family)
MNKFQTLKGWQKFFSLKKDTPKPKEKKEDFDLKHTLTLSVLQQYAKNKPQANLTDVVIQDNVTKKSSIVFFLLPEWSPNFPPYNLARLAAITKTAGYKTYAYDLNAKASKDFVNWKGLDFDPWDGFRDWKWYGQTYWDELHQFVKTFIDHYVDKMVELKPTAVGFCLYYCNEEPSRYMISAIKEKLPDVKILVGGPQAHQSHYTPPKGTDIIISGEGELLLLEAMEIIEQDRSADELIWLRQPEGERLNLDNLPSPDYNFFPPSDYKIPNGVTSELSRGCTAKCVFCQETHFWKYRGRMARNVIEEIEDLYYNRGVDVVWFLDSLVNGNLKELRAFCKAIITKGMKIAWTGYARCDGRMDLEYYKDLADSGCINLSYGIESGSNKVLKDMDKGVTVEEIEQNLIDGAITGVEAFANWIVGFPSEGHQEIYESMVLLYRNRNNNLTNVSAGHGFNIPADTIIGQNFERFNVANSFFEGNWITKDLKNSKLHRLIRLKLFNIFLIHLDNNNGVDFTNRHGIKNSYQIELLDNLQNNINFEIFDFNIIKTELGDFADSAMNEIWPLLRLLYKARGAYEIQIIFDPKLDYAEFGDRLSCNFLGGIDFKINSAGEFTAELNFKFTQSEDSWKFQNFLGGESLAAQRAMVLAYDKMPIINNNDIWMKEQSFLEFIRKVNLSFAYKNSINGKW